MRNLFVLACLFLVGGCATKTAPVIAPPPPLMSTVKAMAVPNPVGFPSAGLVFDHFDWQSIGSHQTRVTIPTPELAYLVGIRLESTNGKADVARTDGRVLVNKWTFTLETNIDNVWAVVLDFEDEGGKHTRGWYTPKR